MKAKLNEIERSKKLKIMYSCESGSRAWGFASPDSDFDIRFIYKKPLSWYLSVSEKKDTVSFMEADLDFVGWELRKALGLIAKSNVPVLEHLFSPIVYSADSSSLETLRKIAESSFSPIKSMYHYSSMSKKYLEKLNDEKIKLKSLFYALRTSLAGRWILEMNSFPPVAFEELKCIVPEEAISAEINDLIAIKCCENEAYLHPNPTEVVSFIEKTISNNEKYAKSLPSGKPNRELMDDFLMKEILR